MSTPNLAEPKVVQSPPLKPASDLGRVGLSRASSTSSNSTIKPNAAVAEVSQSLSKERAPSKLALLAQAKAKRTTSTSKAKPRSSSPESLLNTTRTEYLTPIANGPTATTAITTSYQTLNHLISPTRSVLPPSFPPSDYKGGVITTTHSDGHRSGAKQSKLAMKAKKSHHKHEPNSMNGDKLDHPASIPTIFLPEASRSCASPSEFASLLVDEQSLIFLEVKEHRKEIKGRVEDKVRDGPRSPGRTRSHSRTNSYSATSDAKPRSHSNRESPSTVLAHDQGSFTFDVPSPDDIVLNARRGTSLGGRSSLSTVTAFPPDTPSSSRASVSITRAT
ncbi:hypothetical protein HETIRDRAFT_473103 [Heterobasidion irregulare TC 32-1]|uniref:Uncharacterized protein n=1 Tax=Heterobasidion irregulare (strain TC 32-1) TaxID=747525 RepID=W4KGN0_HETIT|nr:uncharacterized protein HETIRDRAFT_473103 [Heterobasidion irregulare TC 32-1]ETW84470.1 hypothetical protein HETIRDRAFT_473103 [Heterobasidion irregulare TC 32-1]